MQESSEVHSCKNPPKCIHARISWKCIHARILRSAFMHGSPHPLLTPSDLEVHSCKNPPKSSLPDLRVPPRPLPLLRDQRSRGTVPWSRGGIPWCWGRVRAARPSRVLLLSRFPDPTATSLPGFNSSSRKDFPRYRGALFSWELKAASAEGHASTRKYPLLFYPLLYTP